MIIYKVTNKINGKVYIGQTTKRFSVRKNSHIKSSGKRKTCFSMALNKYGIDNFVWEIVEDCNNLDELNNKEVYWISHYNTMVPNGYNMNKGGNNTYKKMPNPKKSWIKGNIPHNKGKIGIYKTDNITKEKMMLSNKNRKEVICYNELGEIVNIFPSLRHTGKMLECSVINILNCIKNNRCVKRGKYKGYSFKYK